VNADGARAWRAVLTRLQQKATDATLGEAESSAKADRTRADHSHLDVALLHR
jgi:hypothetical protein